jgi:hypothetical protein
MTLKNKSSDKGVISHYISAITRDWSNNSDEAGLFEIRCLAENRKPVSQMFALDAVDEATDLAARMNAMKLNVYMSINPSDPDSIAKSGKSTKDDDILRAHFSFADADDVQGLKGLSELFKLIEPDIIVTTGTIPHERRHAYWRLTEPCLDLTRWKEKQMQFALKFKTDKAVVNPSRIMRVAGTVSYPSQNKLTRGYVQEFVTMNERSN